MKRKTKIEEWEILQWKEVLDIKNGKNQKKVTNPKGKYPIYGSGGIMGYADDYICEEGTTIIGRKGSINKPIYVEEKFWNVDTAFGLCPGNRLDNKFFYYYCTTYNFLKHNKATTLPSLTKADLLNIKIPLPPIQTQKKIAQILDQADALRKKTQQIIDEYDKLAQSIFLDMFGDPVANPKGWEKKATITYCKCIVPGRDKPKSFTGNIPWVTTNDLNHLGYTSKSSLNIGLSLKEIKEVKAKTIPFDSVIMTCVGDLGVVSINTEEMVVNQQLHTFQCKSINNVFLMYNLSFQKPYMYKMASNTTVPYMNKTIANNTPTIYPPINLQNQFAEKIKLIEQQKELAKQSLKESEDLFNALLQKAFKGELVK